MGSLNSHMHFRIAAQEKQLVEQAAECLGMKPNTYARQRLIEAAERDIEVLSREQKLFLDEAAWNQLMAIMEQPCIENSHLRRAATRHKQMVK